MKVAMTCTPITKEKKAILERIIELHGSITRTKMMNIIIDHYVNSNNIQLQAAPVSISVKVDDAATTTTTEPVTEDVEDVEDVETEAELVIEEDKDADVTAEDEELVIEGDDR